MTAVELSNLSLMPYKTRQAIFKSFTVSELKDIVRQAHQAYATVGDSPRFIKVNKMTGNGYNTLELTEKLARVYVDIKEGR